MQRLLWLFTLTLFFSCKNSDDAAVNKSAGKEYEIPDEEMPSGEKLTNNEKRERIAALIAESKRTLDSIDVAYRVIRKESRKQTLSFDEREQVNEALMELNDAKDLIVLEMEKTIINELKEKTTLLQTVMEDMTAKSEKLNRIAQTLSRVSGMIEKTTNLLAGALSAGLVRPKIDDTNPPS